MVNAATSSTSAVNPAVRAPARDAQANGAGELALAVPDAFVDSDVMAHSAAARARIEARNKALVNEPKKFNEAIRTKYEPCRLVQSLMASLGALDHIKAETEPVRVHCLSLLDNTLVLTANGFRSPDTSTTGHNARRRFRLARNAAWNDEVHVFRPLLPSVPVGQSETVDSARRRLDAALVQAAQDVEQAALLFYPPSGLFSGLRAAPTAEAATKAIPGAPYFSAALVQQAIQQQRALEKRVKDGKSEPKKFGTLLQFNNDANKRRWIADIRNSLAALRGPAELRSKKSTVSYYITLRPDLVLTKDGFCDRSMKPYKDTVPVPDGSSSARELASVLQKLAVAAKDIDQSAEKVWIKRSLFDRLFRRKK